MKNKLLPGRESGGVTEVSPHPKAAQDVESLETELVEEEITVRQWLSGAKRVVDRVQCLHVFKQVLDFVHLAHGQGVMLRNIRPSCFLLSPLNKVAFIDSRSSSDQSCENFTGKGSPSPLAGTGSSWPASRDGPASRTGSQEERRGGGAQSPELNSSSGKRVAVARNDEDCFPQRELLHMEQAWYTSPEERATGTSSFASDVYSLGVLVFEVLLNWPSLITL